MHTYILSVDQSTSATKAVLFDQQAKLVARVNAEHKQIYPKPGWVEHDPEEIFKNTLKVIAGVIKQSGIDASEVKCLSISNQRETVLVWDKNTGKPVYNAVVWQCMRGEKQCNILKAAGHEPMIRQKTGLIIDPYFSASGLSWILNSSEEIKAKAQKGELAAGTIDSWLVWKLTNGEVHATDYSNACRTLLFNIHILQWDNEICKLFSVPMNILPEPKPADAIFGNTTAGGVFTNPIPISGILGDSHGALFGQRCYHKGLSKTTYGTGSSVMMNIGEKAAEAPEGLVTSIGYGIKGKTDYVFEGNIHSTGATIKWMVDAMGIMSTSAESEKLATSVNSTEGVYFVPAFAGLGAPYWDNKVRACISGIHGGTNKAHIVRAGLESIAYQVKDLLDLMAAKAGIALKEIRVDGGPTRNRFLMQFQADMLGAPIVVSDIEEASALGAALAGGLGTGIWKDLITLEALYTSKGKTQPKMKTEERDLLYNGWIKAVDNTRGIK
ncbi:MAG: glycerol kinase GlpK [Bacteroidales bacterium]|nr:glycerol kinase GlpK [Bacteroidales bacterium]